MAVIFAALTSLAILLLMLWQDGVSDCNDGKRYTSCAPQPTPFHRRLHNWPRRVLMAATWLSAIAIGASLGSWQRALMFATLPGVWFCITRPTTVDMPCMALAWGSSMAWARGMHPLAIALSCASGCMHERGPVFAALYSLSPVPLVGLVAVQWWAKAAPPDDDKLVGLVGIRAVLKAHKPYTDYLVWKQWLLPTRALVPLAAWSSVPPAAWLAFGVAQASRVMGTDNSRFVMWGTPPLLMAIDRCPPWVLALHAMTFVRVT